MAKKKPFIKKKYRMKFVILVIIAFLAALLGFLTSALPSHATEATTTSSSTAGSAKSAVTIHLHGYKTSSKLTIPLNEGVTVSPYINVSTAYDRAYSIDYTLTFNDEQSGSTDTTVYTKTTTISGTTLGDGRDKWTLDLSSIGEGYGTYTLTAVVQGTGQSTDVAEFRYVPVWAKYISSDEETGNPTFNVVYDGSASIGTIKYTVYRSNTSTPVASTLPAPSGTVGDDGTIEGQLTLPLDSFSNVSTNTYSVDFEGVSSGTALGYEHTTTFSYTAPSTSSSDTPDMTGEGDSALLVAAGAAVAAACKKRSSS